jgi:hypothetical protein
LNRARFSSRVISYCARGSRWLPPGRQRRSRARSASCFFRQASAAASGESQKRPPSNHFSATFGWVRCSCFSVGSRSSASLARNAVGCAPATITQNIRCFAI